MSNPSSTNVKKYVERLTETLQTSEPAEIGRRLGISYQAAKNYLEGRLPSAEVLAIIAEQTDYSLNWLLTGKGAKKVAAENDAGEPSAERELQLMVRRMVREEMSRKKGAPVIEVGEKKSRKRA
jgi:transcriptional regulator with XRE-family HTH domain